MIRQALKRDLNQQPEAAGLLSSDVWFVWPGLPEDLPLLSAPSVLAFHQTPAESVVAFSTADPVDKDPQLLEDTRAYLHCLARDVEPGPRQRQAWERFFLAYTRRIHRAAQTRGLSATDAEDCAQEVWLVILDVLRLPGHEPWRRQFSRWMHGVIRNQVAIFARRLARRNDREDELLEYPVLGPGSDPVAAYERNERRRLVRHVLTDLKRQVSPINYRIVQLRWIEGRGVAEVAARLDLTCEQVWHRQSRVKKRLGRLLELHGESSQ